MPELSDKVLLFLEQNRGNYLSGEMLAEHFGVTRAAIWKVIDRLRKQGHQIEALTNRGYSLCCESDLLTESGIRAALSKEYRDYPITVYSVIDSTNRAAKVAISEGAPHGSVILAEEQTDGRGRRGRKFYSPAKTGIYMSVILRPTWEKEEIQRLTLTAAVAVCRALERVLGIFPDIKWVNDIFWKERKVCGILSEAVFDLESQQVESVIVGIGLNVTTCYFPNDLKEIAGSLQKEGNVPRVKIAAAIIEELLSLVTTREDILEEYQRHMFLIGKPIYYTEQGDIHQGIALRIHSDGALVILDENQKEKQLHSSEVSVRLK